MITLAAALLFQQFAPGEMANRLPSGDTLHLIAVCKDGKSWSPTGGAAPDREYLKFLPLDQKDLMFVVEFERRLTDDFARLAFQFPKGRVYASAVNTTDGSRTKGTGNPERWYVIGSAGSSGTSRTADVRVGFAFGHWRTLDKILVREGKVRPHRGVARISHLGPSDFKDSSPKKAVCHFEVALGKDLSSQAVRVVAYDKKGHEMDPHGSIRRKKGLQDYFFAGKPSDISRIEVQSQPYVWSTFKGVKIKP